MVVVLFRLCHNRLGFGHDRRRVHSISHSLLAFTQPVASFFAPFLHPSDRCTPARRVELLSNWVARRLSKNMVGPAVTTDGCKNKLRKAAPAAGVPHSLRQFLANAAIASRVGS
jgi:hypothetical protein